MSDLRSAIADLSALIDALPQRHVLPPEARRETHRMLLAITKGHDVVPAMPPSERLEQVWRDVQRARTAGEDLAALPHRTLRDVAWLLWDPRRQAAKLPGLLPVLLARADARSNMLRRLIEVWLRDFDPMDQSVSEVGLHIAKALKPHHAGPLDRWRVLNERYDFFNAAIGPSRLAQTLLREASLAPLNAAGLNEPMRASGGFMRAVTGAYGQGLPTQLRGANGAAVLAEARNFYAPAGQLRFDEPAARGAMADALVGAWSTGHGPDPLRAEVLSFLRLHLGDPRVRKARWAEASDATLRVVRAWLAQLTLDAFFDVIGRFAEKAGQDLQWQARKAFWSACLRKGWITDSWLALGPNVHNDLAVNRELRGSYGKLENGTTSNHSALLMRIGRLVFVEWSHNGSLHAWPDDAKNVPRLSPTPVYRKGDLDSIGLKFPPPDGRPDLSEIGDRGLTHSAVWQGRVAALLRQREGLRLAPHEWAI
jgi:hypothetical protein